MTKKYLVTVYKDEDSLDLLNKECIILPCDGLEETLILARQMLEKNKPIIITEGAD